MDLLDTLTAKGLRGDVPTREEALAVLATTDDELLDVVAAAGKVRRKWFGRRVKLNYLVNLKSGLCPEDCTYCSQRLGSKAEILKYTWLKPDQAAEAAAPGWPAAPSGSAWWPAAAARRTVTSTGSPTPSTPSRTPTRGRDLRLPRPPVRQPGGAAEGGRRRRLQPQPQHLREHLRRHRHHPHLRGPGGHRAEGARRGPVRLLRPDRRHGRERRGPGRRGVRAARARLGLRPGQLPDPVRGHPARQGVEPHPAALPAHPGDGPLRQPGHRGADRRRARGAPALDAAARPAPRQLHLPRRLPDQRGPGRAGRPRHDQGRRFRGRGRRRGHPAPPPLGHRGGGRRRLLRHRRLGLRQWRRLRAVRRARGARGPGRGGRAPGVRAPGRRSARRRDPGRRDPGRRAAQ